MLMSYRICPPPSPWDWLVILDPYTSKQGITFCAIDSKKPGLVTLLDVLRVRPQDILDLS